MIIEALTPAFNFSFFSRSRPGLGLDLDRFGGQSEANKKKSAQARKL
jgi:hypothetical protein